jgi:trehalose 6-phosphate synthase/phosphatase
LYSQATNRVIFLDCEGTLFDINERFEYSDSLYGSGLLPSLQLLGKDERNTVVLITGRSREHLETWFGSLDGVALAAEYGFFIRWPGTDEWSSSRDFNNSWRSIVMSFVEQYAART